MSSTREDVIRRRHELPWCADSSLNHEWSKTVSFVSSLDACLDAVGVRPPSGLSCLWNYPKFHRRSHRIPPLDHDLNPVWLTQLLLYDWVYINLPSAFS
jgi:hypothetical protein